MAAVAGAARGGSAVEACPAPTAGPLRAQPLRGVLRGDVDGDRRTDRVSIALDPRARRGCRFVLAVRTARGVLRARISGPGPPEQPYADRGEVPFLSRLAAIEPRPGAEIVVEVWKGASTGFVAVYAIGVRGLARMTGGGAEPGFAYAGSVAHRRGVDCVGARATGRIVVSGMGFEPPDRVDVERRFLRAAGTRFEPVATERHALTLDEWESKRFREFDTGPFGSCTVAVARRG